MPLQFRDVRFRYGRTDVLPGLTWEIPPSGRVLLAGRNGAGKTTALRLAAGALRPVAGHIAMGDGRPATGRALRRCVALMPQHLSVVPGLTVAEQVAYAGWLSGRSRKDAQRAAEAALDRVDLGHKAQSRPAHLSGGELRRVGLAEALTKPADLLMLDEPTAGLDPAQRDHFRALLVSLEMPLVVSTHQFDDVDQVFDHVAVIEGGALVFEGSVSTFLEYGDTTPASRQAESAFLNVTAARR